jgi:hypothetical protein
MSRRILVVEDQEDLRAILRDDYVTKPYSPVQLLRIMRGFLGDQL